MEHNALETAQQEMLDRQSKLKELKEQNVPVATHAFSVYALQDPRTDEFYYVGQTKDLKTRYKQHMDKSRTRVDRVSGQRNHAILDAGYRLKMVVLKGFDTRLEAEAGEKAAILQLLNLGHRLTNIHHAGITYRDLSTIPPFTAPQTETIH